MSSGETLEERLKNELEEAGLLASPSVFRRYRPQIDRSGEQMRADVAADLRTTPTEICDISDNITWSHSDSRRVFGFGQAITRAGIAPLDLDDRDRERVTRMGGLLNALVALFDDHVDNGLPPDAVLSKRGFWIARRDPPVLSWLYDRAVTPRQRLHGYLLGRYFEMLSSLSTCSDREYVTEMVVNYVEEMYRAGRRSVDDVDGHVYRAVTQYPFVAMAAPAWLCTGEFARSTLHRHLCWLHDLGEFFGLVDDIVDFEADIAEDAFNLVAARRGQHSDETIVEDVVVRGTHVFDERRRLGGPDSDTPERRLQTVLTAWVNG